MSSEPPIVEGVEATPDDVAALLTARTKDAAGRELGHFTDATRPTAEQVQTRIDIARSLLRSAYGPIPDTCVESAETTVALLASLLTEAAFWPEQTESPQSTYERLRELYLQARDGLARCTGLGDYGAYDLDTSGRSCGAWPVDWWQRDLDNLLARQDALG